MSKSSRRKKEAENKKKGENWPQYLKEMKTLGPALRRMQAQSNAAALAGANGKKIIVKPDNTGLPVVDNLGNAYKSKSQVQKILDKKADKSIHKNYKEIMNYQRMVINKWIEEELKQLLPWWAMKFCAKGKKWPLRLHGIKVEFAHGDDPEPLGHDVISIRVWGQVHSAQKFEWDI